MDASARTAAAIQARRSIKKIALTRGGRCRRSNKNVLVYENDNNDVVTLPAGDNEARPAPSRRARRAQPARDGAHIRRL